MLCFFFLPFFLPFFLSSFLPFFLSFLLLVARVYLTWYYNVCLRKAADTGAGAWHGMAWYGMVWHGGCYCTLYSTVYMRSIVDRGVSERAVGWLVGWMTDGWVD